MITTQGDYCNLRFDHFGMAEYGTFLAAKKIPEYQVLISPDGFAEGLRFPARFAHLIGVKVDAGSRDRLPMPTFLFDDQRAIVELALSAKRFADWKDCGLGKTLEELEWSRQVAHITGKRVLIVTMNEIVQQIIEEAQKFYGDYPIVRLNSRQELRDWCTGKFGDVGQCPGETGNPKEGEAEQSEAASLLEPQPRSDARRPRIAITNYEKFNPEDGHEVIHEIGLLGGVCLDESSRLKTGGGKQKWAIIKSSRGVEYKLSCTGTPAPNDVMEFASQASFLERIRDENDVIWTYFTRNPKTNEWTVKKHARPHFFRWMASWSIYVADPRAYGWRKGMEDIPQPEFHYEEVEPTAEQVRLQHATSAQGHAGTGDLFGDRRLGMIGQLQLLEAAKGFLYRGDNGSEESRCEYPNWVEYQDGNSTGLALYNRHYSAHDYKDGRIRKLFCGPGEKTVLLTHDNGALFVWKKFIDKSGQCGVNCAIFRNEGQQQSSMLIKEAMAIAANRWPGERLYTYVNAKAVKSTNPGCCFKEAGWKACGKTKGGLLIFETAAVTAIKAALPKRFERVPSKKPLRVAQIAHSQLLAGRQTLIWCEYDAEVELVCEELRKLGLIDFQTLGGSTPKAKRLTILEAFRHGKLPLLVGKAKMIGWGQNFQNCGAMIFSGFSDSFESFYQAVRRAFRFGQKERLQVFIPYVKPLEGPVLVNLLNKVGRFSELIREQQEAYLKARAEL